MDNQLEDALAGAYYGAAIGDAMGGPVENNHASRIRDTVGYVDDFLPYSEPHTLVDLQPGYALRSDPGAVTDDTFIRGDIIRFYLETDRPRTADELVSWLLDNADFDQWWRPAVSILETIESTSIDPRDAGASHRQGGGSGWWTPVGMSHPGDPLAASSDCKRFCTIWKAPVEQDLVAAVQAGVAEGLRPTATWQSIIEAMLRVSGPLPRRLIERGVRVGKQAQDSDELIELIYENLLFPEPESDSPEPPRDLEAQMPDPHPPVPSSSTSYTGHYNHEQIPIAVAGFVYAEGEPTDSIVATVNVGRDCDSTATSVGSWVGALHGKTALRDEWVETVASVNEPDIDLVALLDDLIVEIAGSG